MGGASELFQLLMVLTDELLMTLLLSEPAISCSDILCGRRRSTKVLPERLEGLLSSAMALPLCLWALLLERRLDGRGSRLYLEAEL